MSETRYHIVFHGDIQMGQSLAQVKQNLAQLFKLDAAKVESLFTGKPIVLKKNLDEAGAAKFKAALTRAGVVVSIKAEQPTNSTGAAAATAPIKSTPYAWTLAPAGMNLLRINERKKITPLMVSTAQFSLRAPDGNLIDDSEKPAAPQRVIKELNVDLAPAGEQLLKDEERPSQPPPVAAPEWGVAPVGVELAPAKITEPVALPDISHLSLN